MREQDAQPRRRRLAALGASVTVTVVAVLGGAGALPASIAGSEAPKTASVAQLTTRAPEPPSSAPVAEAAGEPAAAEPSQTPPPSASADAALPRRSGSGRRVVFSEGRQRVWLIGTDDRVLRTYLVSGSIYDNLEPGTYSVYSRSEQAYGIDDSGTMKYFVRFTQGERAAIGFHDIPIDDGRRVQTFDQLGTPLSHGCIRQRRVDAIALWDFAPIGTAVVVTR